MFLADFIVIAILAGLLFSVSNFLDKAILEDFITSPIAVTFFTSLFGTIFALALPFFGIIEIPSMFVLVFAIFLGIVYIAPLYMYMASLKMEEVSRAVPIFSLTPIFVVVLGTVFLNEVFTIETYLGIFLAISGSVLVSSKKLGKEFFHLKANKAFWMILTSTVLFAVYAVLTRWILQFSDFWNIFFWSRLGTIIPILFFLLHSGTREEIFSIASALRDYKMEFVAVSELFNNLAVFAQTVALSLGPAALVETATSVQSLFILLMVVVARRVWKTDLGDDLSREAILVKVIASVMIIIGIYLIG